VRSFSRMRLLFLGDIFASAGRRIVGERLADIVAAEGIDLVLANAENAAGGFGITPLIAEELFSMGIEVLTSGNHIWDKREILPYIAEQPRLLRPLNYPSEAPGSGVYIGTTQNGIRIAVLNLQGRVFMPTLDCPFRLGRSAIEKLRRDTPVILVDFHGEASSEKQAFGWYVDGTVSAVVGTHTHVQTADERILPKGTAYLTDLGMTGPYDSVIGSVPELALDRFLRQMPNRLEPASKNPRLCGAVLDIDEATGKARSITRINIAGSQ
jgi:metallophosphoesterase (TIGR00282 family)